MRNRKLLLNQISNTLKYFPRAYKNDHRFIGVFERRAPKLLILDPKLVSDVYVNHFKHFQINDSSSSVSSIQFEISKSV